MKAVPIELKDANEFVLQLHRHHPPVYRDKFRLACIADDGHMCGVIQAARPVSRMLEEWSDETGYTGRMLQEYIKKIYADVSGIEDGYVIMNTGYIANSFKDGGE